MPNPENLIGKGFDARPENINSTGLNKGARHRKSIFKQWLTAPSIRDPDREVIDEVVLALIDRAQSGDVNAIREVLDSMYGKLTDKVESKNTIEHSVSDVTSKVLAQIPTEALESVIDGSEQSSDND